MHIAQAKSLFTARGYLLCSPLRSEMERLPEAPGLFAVFCGNPEFHIHIVTIVPEPHLQTEVATYLRRPRVHASLPTLVAYRVLEKWTGEYAACRHRRLVFEQAEIVEELRKLG